MSTEKPQPFSTFGYALRQIRQKTRESAAEVSGAVEIDLTSFNAFELGESRPTEDILLLLIRHFSLPDNEAAELWRLAGYGKLPEDESHYFVNDDMGISHDLIPLQAYGYDPRVVYTDMVQVMVNNYGVIINFMQGAGIGNGPLAVARVGMSREHAKSVIDVLKTTLDQANALENKAKIQRQLPAGLPTKKKKEL